MTEKEVVLDLSKKIKLGENWYVSIGTVLFSFLMMLIQIFGMGVSFWAALANFIYIFRKKKKDEGT